MPLKDELRAWLATIASSKIYELEDGERAEDRRASELQVGDQISVSKADKNEPEWCTIVSIQAVQDKLYLTCRFDDGTEFSGDTLPLQCFTARLTGHPS